MTQRDAYHHGRLRAAVIEAAVSEVEAVGVAALSMREIARRAGVSHAAPAHHFGDKTGIFTAIATEGFQLAAEAIRPHATGQFGFLHGGIAYVEFALTHAGHFEVMYRPALYDTSDPDLVTAREAAFAVLDGSAAALAEQCGLTDVAGLTVAGWSMAHGLANLLLTDNLGDRLPSDPTSTAASLMNGIVGLGRAASQEQSGAAPPQSRAAHRRPS